MAQLQPTNIPSPGSLGINTEDAGVVAPMAFAKTASNCVVTTDNRLAARKAFDLIAPATSITEAVKQLFEVINLDGSVEYFWTTPTNIYAGYPTYISIKGALSPTSGDWKFCNLQNTVFATQRNHSPVAWRKIAGVWTQQTISMHSEMSTEKPDVCLAAFGRVFTANGSNMKHKIWFSEDLNPLNFTSGGSGSLDIGKALIGNDNIVSLASFGNRLVILCEKQIIIYSVNLDSAPFLSLDETVKGIGCVSRDSVVNTGDDLVWLARQGMVSFSRLVSSDGQLPIGDVSANVHSKIQTSIESVADKTTVKACWWEAEKSILLLFPSQDLMYVFNTRVKSETGPAVTTWNTLKQINCLLSDVNRNLYFGAASTWYVYRDYGSSSDPYPMSYLSGYADFGNPTVFKNLKNISFSVKTGTNQPSTIKWAFDYADAFETQAFVSTGVGGVASEYGSSEYNIAEYSAGPQIKDLRAVGSLSGQYLQFGIDTTIQGSEFALYNTEIHVTLGKKY